MALIEIKNLEYKYISSKRLDQKNDSGAIYKQVLKGIDLDIEKGEKVAIVGPNGAGKSTFLLNLAGLLDAKYRTGSITICETLMDEKTIYKIREKIGFVFQDPNDQLFSTTVFDDVAFGLINLLAKRKDAKVKDEDFISKRVSDCLKAVGLNGVENEIPHFLSFGEKKLAALATVLSYEPEIFILDEPSSNLDPQNRENFIKLLKDMEKTVIIATHDMDMAYEFSSRVVLINDGRIACDGPSEKVLTDSQLLRSNNLRLPISIVPGNLKFRNKY